MLADLPKWEGSSLLMSDYRLRAGDPLLVWAGSLGAKAQLLRSHRKNLGALPSRIPPLGMRDFFVRHERLFLLIVERELQPSGPISARQRRRRVQNLVRDNLVTFR